MSPLFLLSPHPVLRFPSPRYAVSTLAVLGMRGESSALPVTLEHKGPPPWSLSFGTDLSLSCQSVLQWERQAQRLTLAEGPRMCRAHVGHRSDSVATVQGRHGHIRCFDLPGHMHGSDEVHPSLEDMLCLDL